MSISVWNKDRWTWTEDEENIALADVLSCHNAVRCPSCAREIDRGDIAWNSGETEAGTGYSMVEIICQGCDTEIVHIDSWFPGIDDFADVIYVLDADWGEHV